MAMTGSPTPPIFVVSTLRRTDRQVRLRAKLAQSTLPLTFNTDCGLAVDAHTLSLDTIEGLRLFPWRMDSSPNRWWRRELKVGEIACSLAHHRLWGLIAETKPHAAIVLEDDADPTESFEVTVRGILGEADRADPGWDFLYLGRRRWGEDSPVCEGSRLVRPGFSPCLYAYAVSGKGARKMHRANIIARMMPADDFVPALIGVHPRPDVTAAVPAVLRALAISVDIVDVLPRTQWGSGTEETRYVTEAELRRYSQRSM